MISVALLALSCILMAIYTADLASFLTVRRTNPPISGIDDIKNGRLPFHRVGIVKNTSIIDYYIQNVSDVYYRLENPQDIYLALIENRIDAALFEGAALQYVIDRNYCGRLSLVGVGFAKSWFGIAMKKDWEYKADFDMNILSVREEASCKKDTSSNTTQSSITVYYGYKKPPVLPENLKKEITDAYVDFVVLDSRPFEIASGTRFKHFLQVVYDAGKSSSSLQSINISDYLPHPTTVSVQVMTLNWCKTLDSYTVIVDMWTEEYSGIHFCGVTIRATDSDFYLHSFCLCCKPYTPENQTAPNIRKFIDEILSEYGLSLNTNSFIITDNEPKIIAALRGTNRVGCSDHYINKILEHSFTLSKSGCVEVIQTFDVIKSLVASFRRSHRQSIEKDLLSHIGDFLKVFDDMIRTLNDETQPTLHKVVPLRMVLINHCSPKADDALSIMILKKILNQAIQLLKSAVVSSNNSFHINSSTCDSSESSGIDKSITCTKSNILSSCFDKPLSDENLNPLKYMFDLKNDSTTNMSKRKPNDAFEDDDDCSDILKKIKADEEDEYDLSSDNHESEEEYLEADIVLYFILFHYCCFSYIFFVDFNSDLILNMNFIEKYMF
ncbi:unnamed protein product [Rotaria sp. Silwood1]|nr:unnamed protein product [Rotaria sp. Silwood1]